jgi:hypothetical protein
MIAENLKGVVMAMQKFEIQSIDQIDHGSLVLAINQSLAAAYRDCLSRPALKKSRSVAITIKLTPTTDGVQLSRVDVAFDIKPTMPSQGLEVAMKAGRDGLEFVPECPDNPDQMPLDFDGEQGRGSK